MGKGLTLHFLSLLGSHKLEGQCCHRGGKVKEGFKKVEHEVPLQSLQDVFSFEEVTEFLNRIEKQAEENGEAWEEPAA